MGRVTAPTTDRLDELTARYLDAIRRENHGLSTRLGNELDEAGRAVDERLGQPGALGSAALYYVRRGVAVFPCWPRKKTPLTKKGLHAATLDEATVVDWWTRCPDANIGAPTGHTFDVIDVDGREGVLAVYAAQEDGTRRIDTIDEVAHALTPRDGGHHVFIAPTGRGNTTNMLPKVDYRGQGGYVLLAPSIGEDGSRYRWTRPLPLVAA